MSQPTSVFGVRELGRPFSKVDIIIDAYSQLRISGIPRSPTPPELELALMRLEDMASEWAGNNIEVGYNFEQEPDPNSPSGIQPAFKLAFSRNLAAGLISDFNKKVPPTLLRQASGSLSSMVGKVHFANLIQVPYPNRMPIGSGNSQRWNRWSRFYRNAGPFPTSTQAERIFIGDTDDYQEHFDSYLADGEDIASFDIQVDSGLVLDSSSLSTDLTTVNFRLSAVAPADTRQDGVSQVTIIITTDLGRVTTRRRFFALIQPEYRTTI